MKIGMLWFDNSKSTLETKVERASAYYREKYGKIPTTCYINGKDGQAGQIAGLDIRVTNQVWRGHLWMGVEDDCPAD